GAHTRPRQTARERRAGCDLGRIGVATEANSMTRPMIWYAPSSLRTYADAFNVRPRSRTLSSISGATTIVMSRPSSATSASSLARAASMSTTTTSARARVSAWTSTPGDASRLSRRALANPASSVTTFTVLRLASEAAAMSDYFIEKADHVAGRWIRVSY